MAKLNGMGLCPIERRVVWEFENAPDKGEELRINPITGKDIVPSEDGLFEHMAEAVRALKACYRLDREIPDSCPGLPLNDKWREILAKTSAQGYIISSYSMNLDWNHWRDSFKRPSFMAYAGTMIYMPSFRFLLEWDPGLKDLYPRWRLTLPKGWRYHRPLRKCAVLYR